MSIVTQTIGKLPVWKGYWVAGTTYKIKNRVSYLGSEFQAKRDGVLGEPVTIFGNGQSFRFNTADWNVITNGTDAYILHSTINRVYTITETAWADLQEDRTAFYEFCQSHKGWAVDVVKDGYIPPEPEPTPERESEIAEDGTLTLDATVSAEGVVTLNATIDENGVLTL